MAGLFGGPPADMDFQLSQEWFYLLSTIAQTCGTILALGGTFVIFKIDKIWRATDNYRGRVIDILSVWGPSKPIDSYFDMSAHDLYEQYIKIVGSKGAEIFDIGGLNNVYLKYESQGLQWHVINTNGDIRIHNGVTINHDERVRWCQRMAALLKGNLDDENRVKDKLKVSIILLVASIVTSVSFLAFVPSFFTPTFFWSVIILVLISFLSVISIIYTGLSIWQIIKNRSVD